MLESVSIFSNRRSRCKVYLFERRQQLTVGYLFRWTF